MATLIRQHKSYLSMLLAVSLLLAVILGVRSTMMPVLTEVSHDTGLVLSDVVVRGIRETHKSDILAVLDIETGMPLMAVDLKALQERIEALPWIAQAEIVRKMSGALDITVTERVPYALHQHGGSVWLIDATGAPITDRALGEFAGLPLVVGEVTPFELAGLDQLFHTAGKLTQRIRSTIRVDARRWDVVFENGIRVKLADDFAAPYGLQQSWQRLIELDAQSQLLRREVAVVDLRIPDRLIVRLTPEGRKRMDGSEIAL